MHRRGEATLATGAWSLRCAACIGKILRGHGLMNTLAHEVCMVLKDLPDYRSYLNWSWFTIKDDRGERYFVKVTREPGPEIHQHQKRWYGCGSWIEMHTCLVSYLCPACGRDGEWIGVKEKCWQWVRIVLACPGVREWIYTHKRSHPFSIIWNETSR